MLVLIAAGFATIFGVAVWLNPYDADGNPRSMATHTQLGLPPCNMVELIGKPCPACGMTTSFSLLVARGRAVVAAGELGRDGAGAVLAGADPVGGRQCRPRAVPASSGPGRR